MKIKMLENVLHGRDVFSLGDQRTVVDEIGEYFCYLGWAEDVDGKVKTGERKQNEVILTPDSVSSSINDRGA